MAYKRKTIDEWHIEGKYSDYHGWELLCIEETAKDALINYKEYRIAEPMYSHRIRKRRIKKIS